jgi:hypothetical protein
MDTHHLVIRAGYKIIQKSYQKGCFIGILSLYLSINNLNERYE